MVKGNHIAIWYSIMQPLIVVMGFAWIGLREDKERFLLKIKIFLDGKTKEGWLEEAINDYVKRLRPSASIDFLYAKGPSSLAEMVKGERGIICLDEKGSEWTSEEFSARLFEAFEKNGSRLTFVIGGADGLPQELRSQYPLLSLSKMTLTHQMVRLLLVEQLYRAFEIRKGSAYHRR